LADSGGSSYLDGLTNGETTLGVRVVGGLVILSCRVVATEAPTLYKWGLIAMAGVLGIIGFMVMRRRKVTA